MRDVILAALGWVLVLLAVADVFRTVLWSGQGGGPVTGAVTWFARHVLLTLGNGRRALLSALGPVALLGVVTTWAGMLLVGFTLTLQMDPDGIVSSSPPHAPATWLERTYVVGYSLFTLGNGGFVPGTAVTQTMFVVISAAGLFLITLSVTYLLPVVSASVAARSFATSVTSLGRSAPDVAVAAWDGERIDLRHQIREWDRQVSLLGHQHLAYPVLHLFSSEDPEATAPVAIERIDEVLTILDAVEPAVAPPRHDRRQLRASIQRYVRSYGEPVDADRPAPDPPDLGLLRAAGIPLRATPEDFEDMVEALDQHRAEVHQIASRAVSDGR